MEGIESLSLDSLSRTLLEWSISRNIFYFSSTYSKESKCFGRFPIRGIFSHLEWFLDVDIFNQLTSIIFIPDNDLFASRLNAKSNCFVSWHPEPGATAVDVFSIYWANLKCYPFPPFSLLTQVLAKNTVTRRKNAIKHETSAPYSQHQNGTVERGWRSLFDMARCLSLEQNYLRSFGRTR